METTTTNELGTDITIRTAVDAPGRRAYTREQRYAAHSSGAVVNLTIEMKTTLDGGYAYYVRFAHNRGNGWQTAKRSKETFTTELAAREWADARWAKLLTWVRTVEAKPSTFQPDFTISR